MMTGPRALIVAASAAGAAGVAVFGDLAPDRMEKTPYAPHSVDSGFEICLKNDVPFFEGAQAACYGPAELAALMDARVVDRQRNAVTVQMAHPTDMTVETAACATCRDYKERIWEGYYALTSRDQRREAFFVRACGTLAALFDAQPAQESHFDGGSPTAADIVALQRNRRFAFGEVKDAEPAEILIEKSESYGWRLDFEDQTVLLQELANADFDNDGVEEILAFSAVGPAAGTAAAYAVGFFEKDAPTAALSFTPLDFDRRLRAGGA